MADNRIKPRKQRPGSRLSNRSHPESDPESLKLPLRETQPSAFSPMLSVANGVDSVDVHHVPRKAAPLFLLLPITPTFFLRPSVSKPSAEEQEECRNIGKAQIRPNGSHNRQLQFELAEGLAGSVSETDDGDGLDTGADANSAKPTILFIVCTLLPPPTFSRCGSRHGKLPAALPLLAPSDAEHIPASVPFPVDGTPPPLVPPAVVP
uniref:Uncharacterized protein n=1 Tax=Anopheles maculatus TaxID=74869 RepID=A0A182SAM9_9DIPT